MCIGRQTITGTWQPDNQILNAVTIQIGAIELPFARHICQQPHWHRPGFTRAVFSG